MRKQLNPLLCAHLAEWHKHEAGKHEEAGHLVIPGGVMSVSVLCTSNHVVNNRCADQSDSS